MGKKAKLWKVIVGGIVILTVAFAIVGTLKTRQDASVRDLIGSFASIVGWFGIGLYLVVSYLKDKTSEESSVPTEPVAKIEPNSPEDILELSKKRNNIIASLFLIETVGTVSSWITNKYSAGFTPDNVAAIFDLVVHIPMLYILYSMYKNKDVKKLTLITIVLGTIGYIVCYVWGKDIEGIVASVLFATYVIFYLVAKLNRSNTRIANYVLLPLFVVGSLVVTTVNTSELQKLVKEEKTVESEFASSALKLVSKFNVFYQEPDIEKSKLKADEVIDAIQSKEAKIDQLQDILKKIRVEFDKKPERNKGVIKMDSIDRTAQALTLHKILDEKMKNLADFIQTVDGDDLSDDQRDELQRLSKEVITAQNDVVDISKKLLNP